MGEEVLAVLDLTAMAAAAYGRPDLVAQVDAVRARADAADVTVVVAGEFKKGKSSLVNGLVQQAVCPVDADLATAVPTTVRHGSPPGATIWTAAEPDRSPTPAPADLAAAALAARGEGEGGHAVRAVELALPAPLLAEGLVLVDTPGTGGLVSAHTAAVLAALPQADAVVLVSDATSELGEPEVAFARLAVQHCPVLLLVEAKADLQPELDVVLDRDRAHLLGAGLADVPILPVSSALRDLAVARGDRALNAESGYPDLVQHLRGLVAHRSHLSQVAVAAAAVRIADELRTPFLAELAALVDPAGADVEDLAVRRADAERLRGQAARWATALNDGITDATAEMDHLVRARLRGLTADLDAAIDDGDPRRDWPAVAERLEAGIAEVVTELYAALQQMVDDVAATVLALFEVERDAALPDLSRTPADIDAAPPTAPDVRSPRILGTGLTALRGSYSGFLMFALVGQLAGLVLATPVVAALGLALGGKAVRDERERALTQARALGRNAVRRHVDEVAVLVAKDVRDALRQCHRSLRDHFQAQAAEVVASAAAAVQQVERAVAADETARRAREADVRAELGRLDRLRAQAAALAEMPVLAEMPALAEAAG